MSQQDTNLDSENDILLHKNTHCVGSIFLSGLLTGTDSRHNLRPHKICRLICPWYHWHPGMGSCIPVTELKCVSVCMMIKIPKTSWRQGSSSFFNDSLICSRRVWRLTKHIESGFYGQSMTWSTRPQPLSVRFHHFRIRALIVVRRETGCGFTGDMNMQDVIYIASYSTVLSNVSAKYKLTLLWHVFLWSTPPPPWQLVSKR